MFTAVYPMASNENHRFTGTISVRVTPQQRAAFVDAADLAGMTESHFARHLITSALDISPATRLLVVAQTIGEERVRLMLEAVQDKQRLDAADVKAGIEMEALSAGIRLAEQRIATLLSLRLGPPR